MVPEIALKGLEAYDRGRDTPLHAALVGENLVSRSKLSNIYI